MSDRARELAANITINPSCPPETAALLREIPHRMAAEEQAWIAGLRANGVKAAHPDDGWVDCAANTIHLAYATFNDGLDVGDVLALGSPWWSKQPTRFVRITGTIMAGPVMAAIWPEGKPYRYSFEAVDRDHTPAGLGAVTHICAHKRCRKPATQAHDVFSWFIEQHKQTPAHYEVCDKHAEYFTGPAFDRQASERIKRDLVFDVFAAGRVAHLARVERVLAVGAHATPPALSASYSTTATSCCATSATRMASTSSTLAAGKR